MSKSYSLRKGMLEAFNLKAFNPIHSILFSTGLTSKFSGGGKGSQTSTTAVAAVCSLPVRRNLCSGGKNTWKHKCSPSLRTCQYFLGLDSFDSTVGCQWSCESAISHSPWRAMKSKQCVLHCVKSELPTDDTNRRYLSPRTAVLSLEPRARARVRHCPRPDSSGLQETWFTRTAVWAGGWSCVVHVAVKAQRFKPQATDIAAALPES